MTPLSDIPDVTILEMLANLKHGSEFAEEMEKLLDDPIKPSSGLLVAHVAINSWPLLEQTIKQALLTGDQPGGSTEDFNDWILANVPFYYYSRIGAIIHVAEKIQSALKGLVMVQAINNLEERRSENNSGSRNSDVPSSGTDSRGSAGHGSDAATIRQSSDEDSLRSGESVGDLGGGIDPHHRTEQPSTGDRTS